MTASSASYALTLARRSTVLPLSAFASARHYAEGGGIPIIAHPGELILNEAQQGNISAAIRAASSVVNNKSSATSNRAYPVKTVPSRSVLGFVDAFPSGVMLSDHAARSMT